MDRASNRETEDSNVNLVELQNIKKVYVNNEYNSEIGLDDVSISFPYYGLYSIIGESGSGKTTLLNIIGGILKQDQGSITIAEKQIDDFSNDDFVLFRSNILGFIFQDYNLLEEMSVKDNLLLALKLSGFEDEKVIGDVLNDVEINQNLLSRKINELSSGQKQRVAIARALISKPKIILADEPTGNLDVKTARNIMKIFHKLSKKMLVILATHNLNLAKEYSTSIIEIEKGKIKNIHNLNTGIVDYNIQLYDGDKLLSNEAVRFDNINQFIVNQKLTINSFLKIKPIFRLEGNVNISTVNMESDEKFWNIKKEPSKISFLYRTFLAKSFLKNNYGRYFISSIILLFSLIVLFISLNFFAFNHKKIVANYLEDNNAEQLIITINDEYKNAFNEIKAVDVVKGEHLYSLVEDRTIVRRFYRNLNISIYDFNGSEGILNSKYINYVLYDDKINNIIGEEPNNDREVLITDYLYYDLFKTTEFQLPRDLYTRDSNLKITGIVNTDYRFSQKLNNSYRSFKNEYLYNILYAKKIIGGGSLFIARDFLGKSNTRYYPSRFDIVDGREPQAENEACISLSYQITNNCSIGDILHYEDLHKGVHKEYLNEINLYNYFPEGVKIVGIYHSDEQSIAFDSQTFNTIYNDYQKYYSFDNYICIPNNVREFTYYFYNYGEFFEPGAQNISMINKFIIHINNVLIPIFIFSLLLSLFSIVNFVLNTLNKKQKQIGILRLLGMKKNDIHNIFIYQSVFIIVFNAIFSLIAYIVILKYLNKMFISEELNSYKLFKFNLLHIAIVLFLIIVFINLLLYYYIKRDLKKTINENINH